AATGQLVGQACTACGDAARAGRTPGTVLAPSDRWVRHRGDLISLTRLLNPQWRFPGGNQLRPTRQTTAPELYADRYYGLRALDQAASGEVSTGLRSVLRAALSGQVLQGPNDDPADSAGWQLAVVAALISERQQRAALPGLGSLVQIVDPQWWGDEEARDRLYVVRDDLHAPVQYDLVSLGDIGPNVPGSAIAEIDPTRVRLLPAPKGALPYPPGLEDTTADRVDCRPSPTRHELCGRLFLQRPLTGLRRRSCATRVARRRRSTKS
ncbi:hypothetical protein AB0C29_01415, partial [Actinoplanes sp. NPDC048791]|uniref:hypothetical protein n=1 Tax=Actinoplanes sp. NPDC048791 TaxID=3154623 RepID=UPI0033F2E1B8